MDSSCTETDTQRDHFTLSSTTGMFGSRLTARGHRLPMPLHKQDLRFIAIVDQYNLYIYNFL